MNINGYEIPQHLIEQYLRACKYNQEVGTEASDKMQEDLHYEIFEVAGLHRAGVTREDRDFIKILDTLVDDLLKKGY